MYVPKILSHQHGYFKIMDLRFWRKKWLIATVVITIILTASIIFLLTLKLDYDRENDAAIQYFSRQPGMPDAFTALENLTPPNSIVLCWWDYGRAVREWSHREVIEAIQYSFVERERTSTHIILHNQNRSKADFVERRQIQSPCRILESRLCQNL